MSHSNWWVGPVSLTKSQDEKPHQIFPLYGSLVLNESCGKVVFFFFLVPETTVEGETVRYPSPETAGQLYVHHVSESQAILLTRGLKGDRSTAVGIGAEGAGMYQCVASNAEEINTKTVNINVVIGQYIYLDTM